MIMAYIIFVLKLVVMDDWTFHEIGDERKVVPLNEYSKLGSPIERLMHW